MSGGDDDVRWTSRYVDAGALERGSTSSGVCSSTSTQQFPVTARSYFRDDRDSSQAQSVVAVTVQTVDAGARDVNCRVGGPVHGHGQVPLSGGLHAGRTTTQTCSLRHRRSTSMSVVTNAVTTSARRTLFGDAHTREFRLHHACSPGYIRLDADEL